MDREEVNLLKRRRTTARSSLTRCINTIAEKISENNLEELEVLYEQLMYREHEARSVEEQYLKTVDDENQFEAELIQMEEYADKVITCKIQIRRALKSLNNENCSTQRNEEAGNIFNRINSTTRYESPIQQPVINTETNSSSVKLPKLKMLEFNGDMLAYQNWWDQFKVSVHENTKIAKIEKFCYLKGLLVGSAQTAINGIPLSEDNYDLAIEQVQERFGNKDILVNMLMNKLLNLEPVHDINSVKRLRTLIDNMKVNVRNLETLGVASSTFSAVLSPLFLKLLPNEIVVMWLRDKRSKEDNDIDGLLEYLNEEIESRERAFNFQHSIKEKSLHITQRKDKFDNSLSRPSSSSALSGQVFQKKCFFCNGDHWAFYCTSEVPLNQRRDTAKKLNLCYTCLRKGHLSNQCRSKRKCVICHGKHHELVCNKEKTKVVKVSASTETDPVDLNDENKSQINLNRQTKSVLLPTFRAVARNGDRSKNIIALIDSGSQRSYIRTDIVQYLKLKRFTTEKFEITVFGGSEMKSETRNIFEIQLYHPHDKYIKCIFQAVEIGKICNEVETVCSESDSKLSEKVNVDILIGCDYLSKILLGDIKTENGVSAFNTIFGYSISGNAEGCFVSTTCSESINIDLKKFWEIESFGVNNEENISCDESLVRYNETIKYVNKRYAVELIWKDKLNFVPDSNFNNALTRFFRLHNKLIKCDDLYQKYDEIIQDYLNRNVIEEVEVLQGVLTQGVNKICNKKDVLLQTPIVLTQQKGYYMPHRPVLRESGTTQVRIVFDASSKAENGLSLNDCLISGSNLYPEIFDILLRFRTKPVVLLSDIEKAFLQINIKEIDRDYTRFLWMKDNELCIYRFQRVPFGINCSPFLLNATIQHHVDQFISINERTALIMKNNFYVDDLVTTHESAEFALQFYNESKFIMSEASMNLRKWTTNSSIVYKDIERNCKNEENSLTKDKEIKVLGICYNVNDDKINCNIEFDNVNTPSIKTKRMMLSQASKIYDPLGILSPFTIRIKLLIQSVWEIGCLWDEPLPLNIVEEWKSWNSELSDIKDFWLKRMVYSFGKIELHCFTDSSEKAYSACIFVREIASEHFNVSLLCAKTRVAPIKKVTLPRLELLGACLGAKLMQNVKRALQTNEIKSYYWSDSQIVLSWIKSKASRWKTFVANRVTLIQSYSNPDQWHFVSGKNNPADLATRGITGQQLKESILWLYGPEWLSKSESQWPNMKFSIENFVEIKKIEHVNVNIDNHGFEMDRYSSLEKMLRIFAIVYRYLRKDYRIDEITTEEIENVQYELIRYVQSCYFSDDISDIKKFGAVKNKSKLKSLNPFLYEGILLAKSRLKNLEASFEFKNPVILPYEHRFTHLLIEKIHKEVLHLGVQSTLSKLRERFLVIKGRKLVKNIIKNCVICKKFNSKPLQATQAPLPKDRITEGKAFDIVGIDFAGPIFVRDKEPNKSYICLFTCANTRAIHLELVGNLSTDCFLLAFKRFVSRRGLCSIIYTDNAKTFKCAEKELKQLWKSICHSDTKSYFSARKIHWKYIAERSPWWGGFYERLVRTTKVCLRKILGKALLTFEQLLTILTEVEAIINSRPLTYCYNELNEPASLTPNNFLIIGSNRYPENESNTNCRKDLIDRKLYREKLLQQYWKRWFSEYLAELNKFSSVRVNMVALKEGDVMILKDENTPRQNWKLCVIEKLIPGNDGVIRTAIIRTSTATLKRSINHLCPFEVNC